MDSEGDERHLQMYLHRKFYDIIQILNVSGYWLRILTCYCYTLMSSVLLEQTHTVRVSCCRLVTSSASSKGGSTLQLCFLPTEHMAVLVDAIEAREMEDRYAHSLSLFPPSLLINLFTQIMHKIDFPLATHT